MTSSAFNFLGRPFAFRMGAQGAPSRIAAQIDGIRNFV